MESSKKWLQCAVDRFVESYSSNRGLLQDFSNDNALLFDQVINIAWVDAISTEDCECVNEYIKGELLLLDADRILSLRRRFDAWVSIACVLDVVSRSRFSDSLMQEIAKALFFSEEQSIEALLQIAMGTVATTDAKEDVARVVVTAMVSSTDDLCRAAAALSSEYRQKLRNCLLFAVCGSGHVTTANAIPAVVSEAFAHAMQTPHVDLLVRMVSISKQVHEERYIAMIVSCASSSSS